MCKRTQWRTLVGVTCAGAITLASVAAQSPSERTGDCAECRAMLARTPDAHGSDPHDFECATCHHPHAVGAVTDWKATCQAAGCHERAWTESVFHRLDPAVFSDCRNCHLPHVWSAGSDCLSCHDDLLGSGGATVPTDAISGFATFSHASHRDYECSLCHDSSTKHAALTMTERTTCMNCHHGSTFSDRCDRCHDSSTGGARIVTLNMTIAGNVSPRDLTFDHAQHVSSTCTECHAGPGNTTVTASCVSCHHGADQRCDGCHRIPPADSHGLQVHARGSCVECHAGAPVASQQRNACLACHEALVDHHVATDCVACHKVDPE